MTRQARGPDERPTLEARATPPGTRATGATAPPEAISSGSTPADGASAPSIQRLPWAPIRPEPRRPGTRAQALAYAPPASPEDSREPQGASPPPGTGAPPSASFRPSDTAHPTGIPQRVLAKMESAFGTRFSDVRVHPGSSRARELGALAYTQGNQIHVAPGHFAPETRRGQELLGHELAHVVQQRSGRVRATAQFKGTSLNEDAALEAEADALGARAASTPMPMGPVRAPAPGPHRSATRGGVVQRLKYHQLSDAQREAVDRAAEEQFHEAATHFEQYIGRRASEDARAQKIADELFQRSVLLAETVYFNSARQKEKTLEAHYQEIFGSKGRTDITGSVGANPEVMREVFRAGTFREKMSMFYVAMAENQTFNKLLSEYSAMLDKEFASQLGDVAHVTRVQTLQGLNPYVGKRQKKEYFRRAMEWVQMEIDLERKALLQSQGEKAKTVLSREEALQQKEDDEALAAGILDFVTGGSIVGDETTDAKKRANFRGMVELVMRLRYAGAQPSSTDTYALLGGVAEKKALLVTDLETHEKRFSAGLGWLKVLMDRVFAEHEEKLKAKLFQEASAGDVEPEALKRRLKKHVLEAAFTKLGGTIRDTESRKRPDAELEQLLTETLEAQVKNLDPVVKEQQAEDRRAELGVADDKLAESLAERRFGMNFFGPSLLNAKNSLEESRKGTDRAYAPPSQQTSDKTPGELESTPFQLTYRELGQAFYKPEELAERLARFKKKQGITTEAKWDETAQEAFRKELLAETRDKKLPWKPGVKFWILDPKSPFMQASELLRVKVGAALSGTTDRVMRSAKYLGFTGAELDDVLLACLGWMLPAHDHTYYEIMKAAEPYLDIRPKKQPFPDLIIDVDYANGFGYAKVLDYFKDIPPTALPSHYLSLAHKDVLAEKLTAGEKEPSPESTLRIESDHEEQEVLTGDPVRYTVRNHSGQPARYEWYYLRHESGEARGTRGAGGERFDATWMHKGVYKLYCLVYLNDEPTPVATLRYDQLVHSREARPARTVPESGGLTPSVERTPVSAHATFTAWNEELHEVPLRISFIEHAPSGIIACKLEAPEVLEARPSESARWSTYWGRARQPRGLTGGAEVRRLFNASRRKPKDRRLLRAEALLLAAQQWGRRNTYTRTGSINVDIFDTATRVVLKEHFFYVDRPGATARDDVPVPVPAYRVQGGDFLAGIKSSVRLVDTASGGLDVSGDAMVWINFADRARMVWWLNNRSDRSYSVNFRVSSDYLKGVATTAVPEAEANRTEHGSPVNKGKPIISQDRATHQYAILRQHEHFPDFGGLKRKAIGGVVKMFQWKTFDIKTPRGGLMPGGTGILAQPFNAELRKAKDEELKVRLLTYMGAPTENIQYHRGLQQAHERAGQKQWLEDYTKNLRKPGKDELSTSDRRLASELSDEELRQRRPTYVANMKEGLRKELSPQLGPAMGKLGEGKEVDPTKPKTEARRLLQELSPTLTKLAERVREFAKQQALPVEFKQEVITVAFNELVADFLRTAKAVKGIQNEALREKLISYSRFRVSTLRGIPSPGGSDTTPPEGTSAPRTPTQPGPETAQRIDVGALSLGPVSFAREQARLAVGGLENAGNTCYLASMMQLVALSPTYRALFEQPVEGLTAQRRTVIELGRGVLTAIQRGDTVARDTMEAFRTALIAAGWLQGTRDDAASQQDAAMFFRFLMEDFFHAPVSPLERHDWSVPDRYAHTQQRNEPLVQLGGLGALPLSRGRTIDELMADLYGNPQREADRGGDIIHRHTLQGPMPQDLTVQLMRYDFNQLTRQYSPRLEVINVGEELRISGALTPDGNHYIYRLEGFAQHLGMSPRSGHYISYVRRGEQWYRASDENVQPVSAEVAAHARLRGYVYHYRLDRTQPGPFPVLPPSEAELHLQQLVRDPSYEWRLLEPRIRESRNDPEQIRDLLVLLGKEKRAELRRYLGALVPASPEDARLKSMLLDLLVSVGLESGGF
ncbi:eCIS core domain-containing protein [Corallococcus exercitus]|uniref:eCIS core domain-containing protein n=1 Tax=Corallococcus exercitus TaxID=2316736 RepID=UPI0011C3BEE0|nr:DUF4157 domain-containing protein [Corallococcus exercitus]